MTRTLTARLASFGLIATALPATALASVAIASPANAADKTCVGTIKVTDANTDESLGRLSYQQGQATTSFVETEWLQVTPDSEVLSGRVGDLLVDDSTALGGYVGGVSAAPYDEMTTGTGDNIIFETGDVGAPTSGAAEVFAYSSQFWTLERSGELVVKWTQPDSDVQPMAGYLSNNYTGAAADFDAFNSAISGSATPVTYALIPNVGLEDACAVVTQECRDARTDLQEARADLAGAKQRVKQAKVKLVKARESGNKDRIEKAKQRVASAKAARNDAKRGLADAQADVDENC